MPSIVRFRVSVLISQVLLVALSVDHSAADDELTKPDTVFAGHDAAVYDVALSPDGKMLATASFDKTVKLWSVETGAEIATLEGHASKVFSVAFSGDGRQLVTGGEDKTVRLWQVPSDRAGTVAEAGARIEDLKISGDGKFFVVACSDRTLRFFDRSSGKETRKVDLSGDGVRAISLDGDLEVLAAVGADKILRVWRLGAAAEPAVASDRSRDAGEALHVARPGDSWRLFRGKTAPPKEWTATNFEDKDWSEAPSGFGYSSAAAELSTVKTRLDDMRTEQFLSVFLRRSFEVEDPALVKKLVLKAVYDDGFVAYLNGEEVARANIAGNPPKHDAGASSANEPTNFEADLTPHLKKLRKGRNVFAIQAHNASTSSSDFVFTPTIDAVLAKAKPPKEPETPAKKAGEADLEIVGEVELRDVAVSPSGALVAAAAEGNVTRVWSVEDGSVTGTLDSGVSSTSVIFLDDRQVVIGGSDGRLRLWNIDEKKEARTIEAHGAGIRALDWHGQKKLIASCGDDGHARLWRVSDGSKVLDVGGGEGSLLSIDFSADGSSFVTGGADKVLRVYNVADGKRVAEFVNDEPVRAVALHDDGRYYAAAQGTAVLDWRISTAESIQIMRGHGGLVHAVAFSPDGSSVASAGQDKTIRFWNTSDGKQIRSVNAHDSTIYCLEFHPDGSVLASAGYDKVIKLWKADDGSEVRKLEGHSDGVFALTFSSDGKRLFSGSSDKTIRVWDLADGKQLSSLSGHRGWVTGLGLGADGAHLHSVGYGGELIRFQVSDGKVLGRRHVGPVVYSLAVSSGGAILVTANPGNRAHLLKN